MQSKNFLNRNRKLSLQWICSALALFGTASVKATEQESDLIRDIRLTEALMQKLPATRDSKEYLSATKSLEKAKKLVKAHSKEAKTRELLTPALEWIVQEALQNKAAVTELNAVATANYPAITAINVYRKMVAAYSDEKEIHRFASVLTDVDPRLFSDPELQSREMNTMGEADELRSLRTSYPDLVRFTLTRFSASMGPQMTESEINEQIWSRLKSIAVDRGSIANLSPLAYGRYLLSLALFPLGNDQPKPKNFTRDYLKFSSEMESRISLFAKMSKAELCDTNNAFNTEANVKPNLERLSVAVKISPSTQEAKGIFEKECARTKSNTADSKAPHPSRSPSSM
jgi:hypothetical protein